MVNVFNLEEVEFPGACSGSDSSGLRLLGRRLCDTPELAPGQFIRRLGELNGEAKQVLGAALTGGKEPAMLRSAFDLPPVQRASLQNAVNVTFSADIHLRYETAPDLISGIELAASGQKISWNIAEYLTSLEKGVDDLLTPVNKVSTPATPKPSAPTDGDKKT